MTQTSTPAALPAYSVACEVQGNHSLNHLAGYDVLATEMIGTDTLVRVAATIEGGNRYAEALEAMRPIRAAQEQAGGYAYVAQAWTCGCRQVGRVARTGGVTLVA